MSQDTQRVIVALRLPSSHKTWMQEQAKEQERSVNFVARRMIERAMEEKEASA
ncbi:hypothetical protein [Stenotrophomonas rhizophila]|uniref:hypothetical protein n=1 Tax=Stenotrophomonas rhizophila TaxID=216778 RepID=UPI003AF97900